MRKIFRFMPGFSIVLSFLLLTCLFGCAGPMAVQEQAMKPTTVELKKTHNASVSVSAEGGREKDPLGIPQLSNEQLKNVVKEAINESNLFSRVVTNNQDYSLDLYIVRVSQPLAGNDITVNVEIAWKIRVGMSEKVVWQKSITTWATTERAASASCFNRIVLSTQEATRKNIELGLMEISGLEL